MMNIPIFDDNNKEYKRYPRKPRGGAKVATNTGSQVFVPVLKDVMENVIDGKLDEKQDGKLDEWFPFVKGTREISRSAGRG